MPKLANLNPSLTGAKVIILGDSGVGKTSLMNQYVRSPPISSFLCILIPIRTGQQEVQCKLQSYDRRRLPHEGSTRRRPPRDHAGQKPRHRMTINKSLMKIAVGYCGTGAIPVPGSSILPRCGLLRVSVRCQQLQEFRDVGQLERRVLDPG